MELEVGSGGGEEVERTSGLGVGAWEPELWEEEAGSLELGLVGLVAEVMSDTRELEMVSGAGGSCELEPGGRT